MAEVPIGDTPMRTTDHKMLCPRQHRASQRSDRSSGGGCADRLDQRPEVQRPLLGHRRKDRPVHVVEPSSSASVDHTQATSRARAASASSRTGSVGITSFEAPGGLVVITRLTAK